MKHIVRRGLFYLLIYVVILAALVFLYLRVPSSFLPDEDQGFMFVQVNTPVGATVGRTGKVLDQIREYFETKEKNNVDGVFLSLIHI